MRFFKISNESAIWRALAFGVCVAAMPLASAADPMHAIAMYGEPALQPGFGHLPYANAEAPKGGTIRLETKHEADVVGIRVTDDGPGITSANRARLFEPYFTTKTPDEQGQGGTGLGLSLAKDVMDAHAGRIRVESQPGVGTMFTLKFPLVSAPQSSRSLQKVG